MPDQSWRAPRHPPFLGGHAGRCRRWFWLHLGRYKGELCQDCGGRYLHLIWRSPEDLWGRVTGQLWKRQPDGRWAFSDGDTLVYEGKRPTIGLLCPPCFSRRADARGLLIQWVPEVVIDQLCESGVLPDGCVDGHSPDLVNCSLGVDWP